MANTEVFTGSDATLTLAVEAGAEGDAARRVVEFYKLSPVGRATDVEVFVQAEVLEYHEVGRRHPVALRGGNISINGRVGRAYINGALLQLMLGNGAQAARVAEPYAQPAFNLMLDLRDPSLPGNTSTLTVHGVKFDTWKHTLPEDDFVVESATFKGLFITVEDREASGG